MKTSGISSKGTAIVLSRASIAILLVIFRFAPAGAQPSWVTQTPVEQEYYIGIGASSKETGSSHHIVLARDMALEQIASGIAVTISGETSQHVLEQAGLREETFHYNISTMTKASLEGYELVDSWENDDEYWVYYQLSKARYRKLMDNRKQRAASQASEYLQQAERAMAREEISSALAFYLQAARATGPYRGMGLRAPGNDMNSYVDVTVFSGLSNLLSSISIQADPPVADGRLFLAMEEPVILSVNYHSPEGKTIPLYNLPVETTTQHGDCSFEPPLPTDNEGNTNLLITRINRPGNVQIKIFPDVSALTGFDQVDFEQPVFAGLILPAEIATIEVQPLRVVLVASEYNLSQPDRKMVVSGILTEHLMSAGWRLVRSARDADYQLHIISSTRAGTERQGIHTAFATGSIEISDINTMEIVFSKNIIEVNAGGSDYIVAGEKALERLAAKLTEELQGTLWE